MPHPSDDLPFSRIWLFLVLAFGLAWGVLVVLVAAPDMVTRLFGPVSGYNPLFILAVYAPAISGLLLVALHGGEDGIRRFLSRLFLWRCGAAWWLFLLAGIPLLFVIAAVPAGSLARYAWPVGTGGELAVLLGLTLIIGPVEEFGWRGVALPLLQRRMAPLWAGLVLGLIWGVWHLPAFFLSGTPQNQWPLVPFLLAAVAVSVILTALFNRARGSLLLAGLFHFQLNNPIWPDAQPWDAAVFALAAAAVVWLNRAAMLGRDGAVTRVIPPR